MIAFALVLQLQAASIATGGLELAPPRLLTESVALAQPKLQLAPEAEQQGNAPRSGRVEAGQILAGTGLHLLVGGASMVVALFPLFCGLAQADSHEDCDSYLALGLAGMGVYVLGAPAMAMLGAKWAASGDAHITAATYLWAVLVNLGALGGGIAIVAAVKSAGGLAIGLIAGAVGSSTVAALTLEYPPAPAPGAQARLPRLAELARPVTSPTVIAPAAHSGATAPLLAFSW